jgi:hypothetical protein
LFHLRQHLLRSFNVLRQEHDFDIWCTCFRPRMGSGEQSCPDTRNYWSHSFACPDQRWPSTLCSHRHFEIARTRRCGHCAISGKNLYSVTLQSIIHTTSSERWEVGSASSSRAIMVLVDTLNPSLRWTARRSIILPFGKASSPP